MNKVILIGNLARDPELSTTGSGISLARFSIAVNRPYTNTNGERETDFFNIVVWRGLAENCGKYLAKGKKAAIVGHIQNRTYEAQDGSKRYATDIVADEVEFLSPKSEYDSGSAQSPKSERTDGLKPVDDDDDLPF